MLFLEALCEIQEIVEIVMFILVAVVIAQRGPVFLNFVMTLET